MDSSHGTSQTQIHIQTMPTLPEIGGKHPNSNLSIWQRRKSNHRAKTMPHSNKKNYQPEKGTTVNAGERSTKRKLLGSFAIGLIVVVLFVFAAFILGYFASNPNAFNPTPQYDLNIPLRFNYYYNNGTPDYAGTPNFAITIWLTGKTPVQDTILAGQPFTISARADQSNNSSPLKDTRLIVIFFQDSLTSPASNDTDLLPSTGVTILCQGGECNCTSTQCAIPLPPISTSQFFWSKVNGTFYFPISGSFSPVIRFFTLGPNNQTSLLATATGPNIGDITLNVEPASFAQEVYIGNASLVLAIAVFIFGVIESIEIGSKIASYCILKEKKP
jgi:hypothetical protein